MKVKIDHVGVNVEISIEAETTGIGRVTMYILNLIGVALFAIAIADWLLGLLIMAALWSLFFGWLTLWNLYGKELIIINTKSLSYQQTYGFYKMALETKKINRALNISLVPAEPQNKNERFNLIFESYNEHDLPEELYRTVLSVSANELDVLKKHIRRLYFEKVDLDLINQPYMLN